MASPSGSISMPTERRFEEQYIQEAVDAFMRQKDSTNTADFKIKVFIKDTGQFKEQNVRMRISDSKLTEAILRDEARQLIILGMKYEIGHKTDKIECNPTADGVGVDVKRTFTKEYAEQVKKTNPGKTRNSGPIEETPDGFTVHKFQKTTNAINGWVQAKMPAAKPAAPSEAKAPPKATEKKDEVKEKKHAVTPRAPTPPPKGEKKEEVKKEEEKKEVKAEEEKKEVKKEPTVKSASKDEDKKVDERAKERMKREIEQLEKEIESKTQYRKKVEKDAERRGDTIPTPKMVNLDHEISERNQEIARIKGQIR
jgi:hypothetical protein